MVKQIRRAINRTRAREILPSVSAEDYQPKVLEEDSLAKYIMDSWMDDSMRRAGHYLYKLLRAALTEEATVEKPKNVDWNHIQFLARHNSINGLAYYGAIRSNPNMDCEIRAQWRKDLLYIITRQTQMNEARVKLQRKMEEAGVDYIFIKGIVMQDIYPKSGMRQMSDNDILYRYDGENNRSIKGKSQKKMKQIMKQLNAEEISDDGIVDVFLIEKTSLFEMHRDFLGPEEPLYEYFSHVWDRATQINLENPHKYELSLEDNYILILAHSYKHFTGGGWGPREIADVWQYRKKSCSIMDWEYIRKQLEEIGLQEYEKFIVRLSNIIFGDLKAEPKDIQLLEQLLCTGTYGNDQNAIRNSIDKIELIKGNRWKAKVQYLYSRLFPSAEYLKTHYPFYYRHRSMILLLLIWRVIHLNSKKRETIKQELTNLKQI